MEIATGARRDDTLCGGDVPGAVHRVGLDRVRSAAAAARPIALTGLSRAFFVAGAAMFTLLSVAISAARAQSDAKPCVDPVDVGCCGSLLDSAEFDASVHALPPAAFLHPALQPPLPPKAFLDNLPAVSMQGTSTDPGSPGSCEAQSFGYGLGSYTAARKPDGFPKWNPARPENSVSAAYLYALQHTIQGGSCPKGTLALGYLKQLVSFGAPTRERIRYEPDCPYLDAIPDQHDFPDSYPDMRRFRIGSYAAFHIDTDPDAALELIKEFIANGHAVAFSGSVLCGYGKDIKFQDGVIYETEIIEDSGHGQLVVGYDDNVGTPGKTGALLIQNSFGTDWPPASAGPSAAPPGMAYWSYESFKKTQKLAAVAYERATEETGIKLKGSKHAPHGRITRAYQWAPDDGSGVYLILTHTFRDPVFLESVALTEPKPGNTTATAVYGQFISTGYSYLKRTDSNSFLVGTYAITLEGHDSRGNPVSYTGSVEIGTPHPDMPPGRSMAGQAITGSTGAPAKLSQ